MDTPHEDVATAFADRVEEMFESEETLQACWKKHLPGLPFDRTDRWNVVLLRELEQCWHLHGPVVKGSMTGADRSQILEELATRLDYNLFSQVLLNLQNWSLLRYRADTAEEDQKQLEQKWSSKQPSPFEPKAKMFKNASAEEQEFNRDLSTLKAIKVIASLTPFVSFRVSPQGSTPALADSLNLSMLGVGADRYLQVPSGLQVHYFTWNTAPKLLETRYYDGTFYEPAIKRSFISKSGGDALQAVMAARFLTTVVFGAIRSDKHKVLLPRMASLMVITDEDPQILRDIPPGLHTYGGPWLIEFHEGKR